MALSNKFGWLVLTTGNKSEVSVGYSTLYGDTAGGFAVIKDVYKTMVYQLAQHRNTRSNEPVIPERTLTRAPSAELKPNQTDQDTLPPYDVLDPILRFYVEEDRSVREIADLGYDEALVRKIVHMVDRSETSAARPLPASRSRRALSGRTAAPITNRGRAEAPASVRRPGATHRRVTRIALNTERRPVGPGLGVSKTGLRDENES
jgi:NAD+ synthase (glutamine-hydrolysing)